MPSSGRQYIRHQDERGFLPLRDVVEHLPPVPWTRGFTWRRQQKNWFRNNIEVFAVTVGADFGTSRCTSEDRAHEPRVTFVQLREGVLM